MKIYDGIPVPPRKTRTSKLQYGDLAVGQSVYFLPKEGEAVEKTASRVMGSVARFRRSSPIDTIKFAVRIDNHPDTGTPAVGVWRTE
jgi:hypothetical protein